VTSQDTAAPHSIQLRSAESIEGTPTVARAAITIQPYLSEPVSDARCDHPVQSRVGGRPASICAYMHGKAYSNFEPMPHEWSVISVTLVLDEGPHVHQRVGPPRT